MSSQHLLRLVMAVLRLVIHLTKLIWGISKLSISGATGEDWTWACSGSGFGCLFCNKESRSFAAKACVGMKLSESRILYLR